MDKTPRTDAVWRDIAGRITSQQYLDACKIELELSAANAQLAEYKRNAERKWCNATQQFDCQTLGDCNDNGCVRLTKQAVMDQTEQKR